MANLCQCTHAQRVGNVHLTAKITLLFITVFQFHPKFNPLQFSVALLNICQTTI